MNFKPSNNFLKKLVLQAKERMLGLKDHKIAYTLVKTSAIGTTLIVTTAGSVVLAERMIPKNPSMNLELELVPDSTENTTTSVIEQAVTEALTQNTTEKSTYTTTIKPTENITEPVVTTIPVYTETDIVATETTTYYVDPTTNTVKTTTTTRQPSTQATTTKKQTTVTTPKQTTKVTTTTTQKVTQPVTQAPTQSYDVDITNGIGSVEEFNALASQLNIDMLKGARVNGSSGKEECKFMLALLNEDYISDEILTTVFKGYNEETLKEISNYLRTCVRIQNNCGGNVDFEKYTYNKKLAEQLNYASDETFKYCRGENSNIKDMLNKYFITGEYNSDYRKNNAYRSFMEDCYMVAIGWDDSFDSIGQRTDRYINEYISELSNKINTYVKTKTK